MSTSEASRRNFLRRCAQACGGAAGLSAAGLGAAPLAMAGRRRLREPSSETLKINRARVADLKRQQVSLGCDWLVVHHTASGGATVAGLDNYHRHRFGDELGAEYHFVINNGVKGPDGEIQLARWRHQRAAAHLFHPERAPASLAVVLVGNFETKGPPSGAQMIALASLTRALQSKFSIPTKQVTTHRGVDGRLTQCPGKDFSLAELHKRLL